MRCVCNACGTPLIVPESKAGVSGPCPKCGTWMDGSSFTLQDAPPKTVHAKIPDSGSRRRQTVTSGRGRMRADGYLDHEYGERKELFGTLRVLAVTLAVLAVILFVTLYMRQWMSK